MASFLWWRGHATDTTAKLVVRTDTTGTVTIGGALTGSEDADTEVNDGIVVFEFDNLTAGASYNLTITQGVSTESCSVKAMPASGAFNVCWWSCIDEAYDFVPGHLMQEHNPVALFDLGDVSYGAPHSPNPYGIEWIASNTNNGQPPGYDVSDANDHMRGTHNVTGRKKAERNAAYYFMPDDHDGLGGNDWDHSIANANNASGQALGVSTQAEVDTHWWTNNQAQTAYMLGNPSAAATATNDDIPGESAEVTVVNYPSRYFKTTIANTDFFNIDAISHRDALSATDDETKTLLGVTQKAWLIAAINASTATFKVIMSTKKLFVVGVGDNSDTWDRYTTERDEILAAISDVKGVLWCSGDTHNATASWQTQSDIDGGKSPAIDFTACPAGKDFTTNIGAGYADDVKWKISGYAGTTDNDSPDSRLWSAYRVYGLLEITETHIDISLIDISGREKIKRRLLAGSNTLVEIETNNSAITSL